MPFILLLPLVAVAAVVALALGVPGRRVLAWSGGAVGVLVVLTAVSVVLVVGLESARDEERAAAHHERPVSIPVRPVDADLVPAADVPFPDPQRPIDGMTDGDTVLVRVEGEHALTVHQCPADRVTPRACAPGIRAGGTPRGEHATALVELHESLRGVSREVDCREQACVVAAFNDDGHPHATRPIVFGDAAPAPRVLGPVGPVQPGDSVVVRLRALPPGAAGAVTLCVPGPGGGSPRCGAPAPEVPFRAGADGRASVAVPVEPGPVAGGVGRCEHRAPCAIGVVGAPVATPFAPIRFASPIGADVPGRRVAVGLGLALVLSTAGIVIVRRTDWDAPGRDPFAGVSLGDDPFADVTLDDDPGW